MVSWLNGWNKSTRNCANLWSVAVDMIKISICVAFSWADETVISVSWIACAYCIFSTHLLSCNRRDFLNITNKMHQNAVYDLTGSTLREEDDYCVYLNMYTDNKHCVIEFLLNFLFICSFFVQNFHMNLVNKHNKCETW